MKNNNIVYVGQYYVPKKRIRAQELKTCLRNVVDNTNIKEKHFLSEDFESDVEQACNQHKGVVQQVVGKRVTFASILEYANATFEHGTVVLFGNMDVYFDETVSKLALLPPNTVCAITRHDVVANHALSPSLANSGVPSTSQDAWAFRVPCRVSSDKCDFFFGRPGCDNRFAYELASAGYYVWNAAHEVRVFHLHESQERDYHPQQDAIARPYLPVAPHSLRVHMEVRSAWSHRDPVEIVATVHKYLDLCQDTRLPIEMWTRQERGLHNKVLFDPNEHVVQEFVIAIFKRTFGSHVLTGKELMHACKLVCSGNDNPDVLLQDYFETFNNYSLETQEFIERFVETFNRLPTKTEIETVFNTTTTQQFQKQQKRVSRSNMAHQKILAMKQKTQNRRENSASLTTTLASKDDNSNDNRGNAKFNFTMSNAELHEKENVAVIRVFKRCLDREPDHEALVFYTKLLENGKLSIKMLEKQLNTSKEGKEVQKQPHWSRTCAIRHASLTGSF